MSRFGWFCIAVLLASSALAGEDPRDAEIRKLRAESKVLRATISRQAEEIKGLTGQIAELKEEIDRLRKLCWDSGVDLEKQLAKGGAHAEAPGAAQEANNAALAGLLDSIPAEIMPPGKMTGPQEAAFKEWSHQSTGKMLTVRFPIDQLYAHSLAGEISSPILVHGRQAHCTIDASFSEEESKSLLPLRQGMTVTVRGTVTTRYTCPIALSQVEMGGNWISGWSEKHAFLRVHLENCRLLQPGETPPVQESEEQLRPLPLRTLLRAIPSNLMPAGEEDTEIQKAELERWAEQEYGDKILIVEFVIQSMQHMGVGPSLHGWLRKPTPVHGRKAHCGAYAHFQEKEAAGLVDLKEGMKVRVKGKLTAFRAGSATVTVKTRSKEVTEYSGGISVVRPGPVEEQKRYISGWTGNHAVFEICLADCELLR